MRISIVGCSFVGLLNKSVLSNCYKNIEFDITASAGAGNRAIAAMALDHISNKNPDAIVVLWSGINRIDIPMTIELHNSYSNIHSETCHCTVGNQVWYHSGGFGCGGFYPPTPSVVSNYFKLQHKGETAEYFTDLSLMDITGTLSTIKEKNIPYYTGFIYDVHADYSDQIDIMFNRPLDHTLGRISKKSRWYDFVPWHQLEMDHTPFEWAKNQNCLDTDEFHPTVDTMYAWFDKFVAPKFGILSNTHLTTL